MSPFFRLQGSQIELGRRMVLEIVEHVVGRVDGLVEIAEAEQRPLLARRLRFRVVVAKIETVPFRPRFGRERSPDGRRSGGSRSNCGNVSE